MIIVTGTLRVDPAARAEMLAAAREVMTLARAAPGCLAFVMAADPLDDDRVVVLERWSSREDLLAFRGDGPSGEQRSVLLEIDVADYEVVPTG